MSDDKIKKTHFLGITLCVLNHISATKSFTDVEKLNLVKCNIYPENDKKAIFSLPNLLKKDQ